MEIGSDKNLEQKEFLYHYTNIESLALILKNKTIRLRPLNTLDDLQEGRCKDAKEMGKYCFVSSWTGSEQEIIPMWKMYTTPGQGLRIQLRKNPFVEYYYSPEEFSHYTYNPNNLDIKTAVPLYDVINSNYCITSYFLGRQLYEVEYTKEEKLLNPILFHDFKDKIEFDFSPLGKYKNEYWSFQNEWRYILTILPVSLINIALRITNDGNSVFPLMKDIANGKYSLGFDFYDMKIDENAFSELKILLSPTISAGNKVVVENLVKEYLPDADIPHVIQQSKLTGLIR